MNDLTVEKVTGRLRNVEQRQKNTISAVDKEGRLLLTEEEWLARLKIRDDTGESNGPSSRKGGKKSWKSRRRMHGKEADQKKEESTDDGPIQCSYCGKRGHLSKNCWSKLRNKETAESPLDAKAVRSRGNLACACTGKRGIKRRRSQLMTGQSSARTVGREVT